MFLLIIPQIRGLTRHVVVLHTIYPIVARAWHSGYKKLLLARALGLLSRYIGLMRLATARACVKLASG